MTDMMSRPERYVWIDGRGKAHPLGDSAIPKWAVVQKTEYLHPQSLSEEEAQRIRKEAMQEFHSRKVKND